MPQTWWAQDRAAKGQGPNLSKEYTWPVRSLQQMLLNSMDNTGNVPEVDLLSFVQTAITMWQHLQT